jgi:acyl dehydratase
MSVSNEARFTAVNIASESENRIHADDEARRYGFKGGLVPGIGTFAYVCEALRQYTSDSWLTGGFTTARFSGPIYDGETITVHVESDEGGGQGRFVVTNQAGRPSAEGRYSESPSPLYRGRKPQLKAQEPWSEPKQMLGSTLVDLEQLGSVAQTVTAEDVSEFLTNLGLDPAPYLATGRAPVSYVARLYVSLMRNNFVRVGPSIHAGLDLQVQRPVEFGETLNLRSRVDNLYRRAGQNYWAYETGYFDAEDKPAVWTLQHAIYQVATRELSDVAS